MRRHAIVAEQETIKNEIDSDYFPVHFKQAFMFETQLTCYFVTLLFTQH